ncbi:undecaprenyldiphospho-muramoylpentapeptide beta-N-acetylglucosaminyltransferase [Candidatus Bipolaricaulota bacterium]|nr:undecaprenyldiphospho-muramoylpentapeptide beta-N-acetylglucosaminyltransferase [Candidatus Bipolaricaulota bacterium]
MRLLVAGGGTGGHFYPALAVMKKLHKESKEHKICYIGTGRGLEARIAPQYDWLEFKTITIRGLSRQSLTGFLKGLALLPLGLVQAFFAIRKFDPDVIYGTGGYTTFPPAFWGLILRIPVLTHELNLKPGVTNRILSRFVTKVLLSYPDTRRHLTVRDSKVTGTPVRREIDEDRAPANPESFGLKQDSPIILLFGGSKGSKILIEKVIQEFEQMDEKTDIPFQFLIQTGRNNYPPFSERVESLPSEKISVVEYIENMGEVYRMSDLVICRGGAGTMAELVTAEKPAIIVPWSGAAEDHQYYNGKYLEQKGAAFLVEETEWLDYPLVETLTDLLSSRDKLREMSESYSYMDGDSGAGEVVKTLKDTISEGELC